MLVIGGYVIHKSRNNCKSHKSMDISRTWKIRDEYADIIPKSVSFPVILLHATSRTIFRFRVKRKKSNSSAWEKGADFISPQTRHSIIERNIALCNIGM